jgi:hypothetical protein
MFTTKRMPFRKISISITHECFLVDYFVLSWFLDNHSLIQHYSSHVTCWSYWNFCCCVGQDNLYSPTFRLDLRLNQHRELLKIYESIYLMTISTFQTQNHDKWSEIVIQMSPWHLQMIVWNPWKENKLIIIATARDNPRKFVHHTLNEI